MSKPQLRFKGFEDEWQEALVSEKCNFSRGQGYSKSDLKDSGHPIFLYGRLYTKYSTFVREVDTYAALFPFAVLSTGKEIVMPSSGEEADGISVASAILSKDIILGGGLNILLPNQKEIHNPFLALNLTFGSPHKDLAKRAQGKSVVHLYNQDIASVLFNYPCIEEQALIADFFRRIDEMISEAEREVNRLEKMKQASLQKMFPRPGASAPEIRFNGFSSRWRKCKLSELLTQRIEHQKITDEEPLLAFSYAEGVINPDDKKSNKRDFLMTDKFNKIFSRTEVDDIIYNPANVIHGAIHRNTLKTGVVSPIYKIFRCNEDISPKYMGVRLRTSSFIAEIFKYIEGTVIKLRTLSPDSFLNMEIDIPESIAEQDYIGEYFYKLDNLISSKRQKLVKLRNIKQACLDKMFVNTSDL